jgi:hypothetical protein
MTAHFSIADRRADLPQLRRRIIGAYRRAQEIIAKASSVSSSRTHGLMHTYEKVCDQMRADIAQASNFFSNADALLAWLLDDSEGQFLPERDRMGLGIAARAMIEEVKKAR